MNFEAAQRGLERCKSIEEMRTILDEVLNFKRDLLLHLPLEYFSTQEQGILYRGSKCDSTLQKDSCNISRLRYPDVQYVTKHGRANRKQCPMFYCSDMEIGAYCESNLEVGDELILSYWRLGTEIPVMNVGNTHLSSKMQLANAALRNIDKKARKWLSKTFTFPVAEGQEELYMPSIAITEKLLSPYENGNPAAAGIIYPSMKSHNAGKTIDNLAISPWFFNAHMTWVQAEHIVVTHVHSDRYDIRRLDHSKALKADGTLIWKNFPSRMYNPQGQEFHIRETPNGLIGVNEAEGTVINLRRGENGELLHVPGLDMIQSPLIR